MRLTAAPHTFGSRVATPAATSRPNAVPAIRSGMCSGNAIAKNSESPIAVTIVMKSAKAGVDA